MGKIANTAAASGTRSEAVDDLHAFSEAELALVGGMGFWGNQITQAAVRAAAGGAQLGCLFVEVAGDGYICMEH